MLHEARDKMGQGIALIETPINGPSCPSAMITPEAVINPDTTGWERNWQ